MKERYIMGVQDFCKQAFPFAMEQHSSQTKGRNFATKVFVVLAAVLIFCVTQVTFATTAHASSVESVQPSGTEVSIETTSLVVNFTSPMDIGQVLSAGNAIISGSPGLSIDIAAASWSADGLALTLPINGNLERGTTYMVVIGGLFSASGIPLLIEYTHTFTTDAMALDAIQIVAAGEHTFVIQADGTLWAWGSNNNGQLGLGDTSQRTVPTLVSDANLSGNEWTNIAS
ncbi:MAG: Ig-like domain-containing protein, partial [Coriobacteriia bacterium]|nr:Ig-like domain-containing protein [Coriobacteriia bacterium]